MKPDWKDAPEWAKYLAMDEKGCWNWFENEPRLGHKQWDISHGKFALAWDWELSLTKRPETSGTTSGGAT